MSGESKPKCHFPIRAVLYPDFLRASGRETKSLLKFPQSLSLNCLITPGTPTLSG